MNLAKHLKARGISVEALSKSPETLDEFSRTAFLHHNYIKAREEVHAYAWIVAAVPFTAATTYLIRPSAQMLICSIVFAALVIGTCVTQILRRRRTMKDLRRSIDRLVRVVEDHQPWK
jgi:hypothetical protein